MGQHADDIINGDVDQYTGEWLGNGQGFPRSLEDDFHCHHRIKHFKPFTWWVKSNGRKIRVSRMTVEHLTNSINKIKREPEWRQQWLKPLTLELESRNECDATESDIY